MYKLIYLLQLLCISFAMSMCVLYFALDYIEPLPMVNFIPVLLCFYFSWTLCICAGLHLSIYLIPFFIWVIKTVETHCNVNCANLIPLYQWQEISNTQNNTVSHFYEMKLNNVLQSHYTKLCSYKWSMTHHWRQDLLYI